MNLTKSKLAIILSKLKGFENPKFKDEQYTTDSEVAATILWNAYMAGDIENQIIADLGSGTGILGLGAILLGATKVYFVEKDKDALKIFEENLSKIKENQKELQDYETKIVFDDVKNFSHQVDVVFQNPPFGIKKLHADRSFLEKAFEISKKIYSFHKSESTSFLQSFSLQHKFAIVEEHKFAFPIKQTMKYHTSKIKRIEVSCYKFEKID